MAEHGAPITKKAQQSFELAGVIFLVLFALNKVHKTNINKHVLPAITIAGWQIHQGLQESNDLRSIRPQAGLIA